MALMDENYDPRKDDILLWNPKLMSDPKACNAAVIALLKLQREKPKSIVVELNMYRKHVPKLLELYFQKYDIAHACVKETERFHSDCEDKKYKRWTDEEDNVLIDLVCEEEKSPMEIALCLGRSVSAIKTRVSVLVGKKRLSQKIAGKFIGTINGEETETSIDGIVYKEA